MIRLKKVVRTAFIKYKMKQQLETQDQMVIFAYKILYIIVESWIVRKESIKKNKTMEVGKI